jgi:hypothetical protein
LGLNRNGHLFELLGRAKRRHILHVAVDEASLALSVTLGVVILLLVLGTEILNWYWPAAIHAGGLVIAVIRIRKRVPASYTLLQTVDGRLSLHDSLSTAYYFSELAGAGKFSEATRDAQWVEADKMSKDADIRSAVPFRFPTAAYSAIPTACRRSHTRVCPGTQLTVEHPHRHDRDRPRPPQTPADSFNQQ